MAGVSTPFLADSAEQIPDDTKRLDQSGAHEDVSDGLMICRRASSWFVPSYTRKDCQCGHCSIADTEPCPYAKPASARSLSSVLSAGHRSFSRLLSGRDQALSKDI